MSLYNVPVKKRL